MNIDLGVDPSPGVRSAIEELAAIIKRQYPEASFRISRGEDDPAIVQLVAIVDVDDTDDVLNLVMPQLLDLHDQDLPVFVVTERPPERMAAMWKAITVQRHADRSAALS
jgi:hypothetical protein